MHLIQTEAEDHGNDNDQALFKKVNGGVLVQEMYKAAIDQTMRDKKNSTTMSVSSWGQFQ